MADRQSRPLRIGLVSYRSNPFCGGQGVYVRHLSRALVDLGHHVTVLAGPPMTHLDANIPIHPLKGLDLYNPSDPFRTPALVELMDPVSLVEWLGVSSMGFPEPFTFGLRLYKYLLKSRVPFDILHDNQSLSYGIWALRHRYATVATIHHPITVDRRIAVRAARSIRDKIKQLRWHSFLGMQQQVARAFSHLITVSDSARKDIARAFDLPEERLTTVANGISTDRFFPLPGVVRDTDRVITTTSADTPLKGLVYLLLAIYLISQKRAIRLCVVGSLRKNGSIAKVIGELGIGHLVRFTGPVAQGEYRRLYARASVAVVPSIYEGFGLPAGEAMACGVPVVSTRGGALPEVVGDAGVLVPARNARALAVAIMDLLDNPQRARQLGDAGYRRVKTHFTWAKAGENTVRVYREAMHANRQIGQTGPSQR